MSWLGIHGHDPIVEAFGRSLRRGRLDGTYLFVGPPGIGKRTFAVRLAQSLFCQNRNDLRLEACGACPACQQVDALSHPDLELVGLPEGRSAIPLELLIGDKAHRMQEGLCHRIAMKPAAGGRKIAIIDDVDQLNQEGANCLLKTLEEPPPRSLIVLIGTSEQRQLPTIRSRAQVVRFRPLAPERVAELLLEKTDVQDAGRAGELAQLAEGSLATALELADPELYDARSELLAALAQPDWDRLAVVRQLGKQIEAAGSEASRRRQRLRRIIDFAMEFYRQLMRHASGRPPDGDQHLHEAVTTASQWWPGGDLAAAHAVQRCLAARWQADAHANQATLLACWIDDLAEIACGRRIPAFP